MPFYLKYIRKIKYYIPSTGLQAWTLEAVWFHNSKLEIQNSILDIQKKLEIILNI